MPTVLLPSLPGTRVLAAAAFVLLSVVRGAIAQDVMTSKDGDRIVGEIQGMQKDVVTFSTSYSDADFRIDWAEVASLESVRQFLVETFAGQRLSGPLRPGPAQSGTVLVGTTSLRLD